VWAHEEPQNMGAWRFGRARLLDAAVADLRRRPPSYAGRPPSASPATGSHKVHLEEQAAVVRSAIGD